MKKLTLIGLLLSTSVFATDFDGYNPQIFENKKWSSYDICYEAMFVMTIGIRNEYNIKVKSRTDKKTVWNIILGEKVLETSCRADGYYTGHFLAKESEGIKSSKATYIYL